jgi:hypothetical protein
VIRKKCVCVFVCVCVKPVPLTIDNGDASRQYDGTDDVKVLV